MPASELHAAEMDLAAERCNALTSAWVDARTCGARQESLEAIDRAIEDAIRDYRRAERKLRRAVRREQPAPKPDGAGLDVPGAGDLERHGEARDAR